MSAEASLQQLRLLSARKRARLEKLGIVSVRGLASLLQVHDCHREIRSVLGWSESALDALRAEAVALLPADECDLAPAPLEPGWLGVIDADFDLGGTGADAAPPVSAELVASLPRRASQVSELPPVRNQGNRGSCVAFGVVAVREHEEKKRGSVVELSEQHLYYQCKKRDGHNGEGTSPPLAGTILVDSGVCTRQTWPYNPQPIPGNPGQGPPPPNAAGEARKYRIDRFLRLDSAEVYEIKAALSGTDAPAPSIGCLSMPVFPSAGNAETYRTGRFFEQIGNETPRGYHLVAVAGYEDDSNAPGGGWIIIRNSWGPGWGRESPDAPGYGRISYNYWRKHVRGAWLIELNEPARPSGERRKRKEISVLVAVVGLLVGLFLGVPKSGGPDATQPVVVSGAEVVLAEGEPEVKGNPVGSSFEGLLLEAYGPLAPGETEVELSGPWRHGWHPKSLDKICRRMIETREILEDNGARQEEPRQSLGRLMDG